MKINFLVLCYFLLSSTFAVNLAKTLKLKGSATMLAPGQKEAVAITKKTTFPENASIVTEAKSFLIIKFNDGSKVTLGPKSKIILSKSSGPGNKNIIGLLTGKLKAKIIRNGEKKENKFYVKTRSAAMGIRGTAFQASFNPKANVTSLVTFQGKVAMAKIKTKATGKMASNNMREIDKVLKKNAVIVKKGRFAGVYNNMKKSTAPVLISPKQFTLLKINKSFGVEEKKIDQKEIDKELKKTKEEFSKLTLTADEKVQKASFSKKDGTLNQKSGGFVDLDSGIYVPPAKNSTFNKKLNIYESNENMGKVDNKGNYIPPAGVKLDAKKGFVAINSVGAKLTRKLNNQIAAQIIPPKKLKNKLDDLEDDVYNKYFKSDY